MDESWEGEFINLAGLERFYPWRGIRVDMRELSGEEIAEMVEDFVHRETQIEEGSVILTTSKIEELVGSPDFDFGGDEYEDVEYQEVPLEKRDEGDEYGWWELDPGIYVVEFNEGVFVPEDRLAVLQGWWRLTVNGVIQTTQTVRGDHPDFHQMLRVTGEGASIKENARISELRALE